MDFTERAASEPRETAELLPRLPPGDVGARIFWGGGTGVATDALPETIDLADTEGAIPMDEFLRATICGGSTSSNANSSPIARRLKKGLVQIARWGLGTRDHTYESLWSDTCRPRNSCRNSIVSANVG